MVDTYKLRARVLGNGEGLFAYYLILTSCVLEWAWLHVWLM